MSKYQYLYESAQLEHFERQLLSGYITESRLVEMIENNELSQQQLAVVEELFGGLRNIGSALGRGVANAGRSVANTVGQAGRSVANTVGQAGRSAASAVGQAGRNVANVAGQAGQAVKQGAQQVGQNVKNMYQAGEAERASAKNRADAERLIGQLEQVLNNARQMDPQLARFLGNKPIDAVTVYQLKQFFKSVAGRAQNTATASRNTGFTGGVGQAMSQGFNQ
jgi:cell division septum initiation protein DivIVA